MLLFNRYEYNPQTDLIGKGGFSRVYKAFDKKFSRWLAIKIYKSIELSERYSPAAEIQRVIELDHPNISRYIDIEEIEKEDMLGEKERIQVCIMELLDGGTISNYYNSHKDLAVLKKLLVDVLHGLDYLHSNGIIHRDIKPGNILIKTGKNGPTAKITDFGISKNRESANNSTNSALIVSIPYMAPEQLNPDKYGIEGKISFNIDFWSLGVAVYEILTGDDLFKNSQRDSSEQIMTNIINPELPEKIKELPAPFNHFVAQCVIKDAKLRATTAAELLDCLNSVSIAVVDKTAAGPVPFANENLSPGPAAITEPSAAAEVITGAGLRESTDPLLPVEEVTVTQPAPVAPEDTDDTQMIMRLPVQAAANDKLSPLPAAQPDQVESKTAAEPALAEDLPGADDTRIYSRIPPIETTALSDAAGLDDTRVYQLKTASPEPIPGTGLDKTNEPGTEDTRIYPVTAAVDLLQDVVSPRETVDSDMDHTRIYPVQISGEPIAAAIETGKPSAAEVDDTRIYPLGAAATPVNDVLQEQLPDTDDTRIFQPATVQQSVAESAGQANQAALPEDETKLLKTVPPVQEGSPVAALRSDPPSQDDTVLISTQAVHTAPTDITAGREGAVDLFNRYAYYPAMDLIGKGGFSRVYKALDKKLNRWVALKIYKTGEFSDRYSPIAEIQRVVNLDHPNICRYLDIEEIEKENSFGEKEKIQICVMELLDSGNFLEYYNKNNEPAVFKKLLQDVLNGISYLHRNGIIHRDIKPANILIKHTLEGPVAKITDFGISKKSDSVNNHSSSAMVVSIPYMAPEQLNVKKYGVGEKITYNLDLWALGVTVYEVLTGNVLFKNSEQDNPEQIMTNIMLPELPAKISQLPQPYLDIVAHCLVKNANNRAQKAEELMVLLNNTTTEKPADKTLTGMGSQAPEPLHAGPVQIAVLTAAAMPPKPEAVPAAVPGQPAPRRKLSVLDSVEETPARPPVKSGMNFKKAGLWAAALLAAVVVAGLFIFPSKTAVEKNTVSPVVEVKAKDTVRNKQVVNPVIPSDTARPALVEPVVKQAVNTATEPRTEKPRPIVKETPAPERKKQEAVKSGPEALPEKQAGRTLLQKYPLVVTTGQACSFKISSAAKEEYADDLQPGQKVTVYLVPGNYTLRAYTGSKDNPAYSAKIEITPMGARQMAHFKIPLQ